MRAARGKKLLAPAVLLVLVVLVAASLTKTLFSAPADTPTRKDIQGVARQATPKSGGHDERVALPAQGFVVGQGIVEPADREVHVSAPVAGVVARVLVKEGDVVEAGTPLLVLEDGVERAAVASAEATHRAAQAELARAQSGLRPEEQAALAAEARAAEARAKLAEGARSRAEALAGKGAAPRDEADRTQGLASVELAMSEALAARARAARGGWARDIAVAEAKVQEAERLLLGARAQLERLTVTAKGAGTVLEVLVRAGEYHNPATGTPLLTMGDLSRMRVRIDVDERDVARLAVGQRGHVVVEAFGDRRFAGQVVEVARRMGRKNLRTDEPTERIDTRIREVTIELADGHELVPGLRATGYLEIQGP
jgi:multidrug resistance efflux pump